MDLRQLRYFIAVAEELHFGRAAARLFISQPALSFDIKKLEEQLGTQLLLRNNKSVKLTGAGQVLLVEARNLLLQAEKVKRLTQLSAEGDVGQLRVGFVNSMLYRGLPRAMSRFEREHPNMEVVLGEMNSAEQAQALQRGQIDLGFVHWGRLPAEIVSEPLISDPFLCCLPAGHRHSWPGASEPRRTARRRLHPLPAPCLPALPRPDHRPLRGRRLQPAHPPRGAPVADRRRHGRSRHGRRADPGDPLPGLAERGALPGDRAGRRAFGDPRDPSGQRTFPGGAGVPGDAEERPGRRLSEG